MEQEESINELVRALNLKELEEELLEEELPRAGLIEETNEKLYDSNRKYMEQTRKFKEHLERKVEWDNGETKQIKRITR